MFRTRCQFWKLFNTMSEKPYGGQLCVGIFFYFSENLLWMKSVFFSLRPFQFSFFHFFFFPPQDSPSLSRKTKCRRARRRRRTRPRTWCREKPRPICTGRGWSASATDRCGCATWTSRRCAPTTIPTCSRAPRCSVAYRRRRRRARRRCRPSNRARRRRRRRRWNCFGR